MMRFWLGFGVLSAAFVGFGATTAGCAGETSDTGGGLTPIPTGGNHVGGTTQGGGGSGGSLGGGGSGGDPCLDTELCNGVDDDCDGSIDEDCPCIEGETQDCYSGDETLIGIGECDWGTQTCDLEGQWGACEDEILPTDEQCNGLDDDCDAFVDEELGDVVCGLGICQRTVPACADGEPVPCVPGTSEPPEDCEGTDDDCDGDVDEGCPCVEDEVGACYTGSAQTRNVGECHDGTHVCDSSGAWGECTGDQLPDTEACNGLDDDCDGDPNDDGSAVAGFSTPCDGADADKCIEGVWICQGGPALVCSDPNDVDVDACNGVNDSATEDCDPTTPDGSGEANFGSPCDGGDSDLCAEGQWVCQGGPGLVCTDNTTSDLDVCDGINNDCDTTSADGSEGPQAVGTPCDGPDSDLCTEGSYTCTNGTPGCSDNTTSNLDVCDGVDNDCDATSADGSEGPQAVGTPCDGPDSDFCTEGSYTCTNGTPGCSDTSNDTLDVCDGQDNDCDATSADGSEGPQAVGLPCDGPDSDLCPEGFYTCSNGTPGCSDSTDNTLDVCDGQDNDCDGASADGSEGPQAVGLLCDGPDSDLCPEGFYTCTNGTLGCSDTSNDTLDVCDGLDNDCDGTSADGSEGPQAVGLPCDGADSDLCPEGFYTCTNGTPGCSDSSDNTLDVCDGTDNDCDGSSADGSEGPQAVGLPCDGPDTDLCPEGYYTCTNGTPGCSDTSNNTVEICDNNDNDCDTLIDEGNPQGNQWCDTTLLGACRNGLTRCASGGNLVCDQVVFPEAETCSDGVDDDCNGWVDDGPCWCNPLAPATVCGAGAQCHPQPLSGGQPVAPQCETPTGTATQHEDCTGPESCGATYNCIDVGGPSMFCGQWCRVGGSDCPSGSSCFGYVTPLYIGLQEWGGCWNGWSCDQDYLDASDGCDCGCGIVDPDCPTANKSDCDFCYMDGSCALDDSDCNTYGCTSSLCALDPTDNSWCI